MGLLQKAVETYDAMAGRVGIVFQGENEPLAPISHIMKQPQIKITLDQNGNFVTAQALDKDTPKIIIPATEESAGRTSKKAAALPHPLCDYLRYLLPQNQVEYQHYIAQLSDWTNSPFTHPKLHAVLHYVQGGTILADLSQAGIAAEEKAMVCWEVNGLGKGSNGPCWTDRALMNAFIDYTAAKQANTSSALCMVSGETEVPAGQHPKGIIPTNGNAKLISANDSSGFTYRGRFDEAEQAATVGYAASQKAHNALRWLVANQSVSFGGRTFLCWNPRGIPIPRVTGPMGRKSGITQRSATPSQYQKQLRETLSGWKENLRPSADVIIAAFDAATTGRLAVTYYNELLASDFLDRLHDWEASCCWENGPYGIQSPSLFQIVSWAFGTPRDSKAKPDDRILKQQMQRLVACRVNKAPFPLDIERALVERANNLQLFPEMIEEHSGKTKEKIRKYPRTDLLFTACAAIRKYHYDHLEEEWDMALDTNCSDRSYLFGRLLAIAEAVENSTYTDEKRRETNAMRMQKALALRPMSTWRFLEEKLEPYYKQLKPGLRQYYRNLTQEVVDKLPASDSSLNQKLEDIYLLGYYHQRAYRTEKADKQETEEES